MTDGGYKINSTVDFKFDIEMIRLRALTPKVQLYLRFICNGYQKAFEVSLHLIHVSNNVYKSRWNML